MSERLHGRITGLYTGDRPGVRKTPVGLLEVNHAGIVGDRHAGLTRLSGVRDKGIPKGTKIPNDRQWSAVSDEELKRIAELLDVPTVDADWLGANLAIEGIPDLSKLPEGTRLKFPHATLIITAENIPCIGPGEIIANHYQGSETPVHPSKFVRAAWGRRGVVGTVAEGGMIHVNDPVDVIIATEK